MKGCFNLFIGFILATLAAFVVGGGVCLAGIGMISVPNGVIGTFGQIILFGAIPIGISAFCFVLVKWINRKPAVPAEYPADTAEQENQTDKTDTP